MKINNNIQHIQRVSQKYQVLLSVLIVSVPIIAFLYWFFFNHLPNGLLADLPILPTQEFSALQLVLGFLVSLLPMSVALYGLITLKGLFQLYARGIIFSAKNVTYFHRLGHTFIAWVIASALFTPLISMVITFNSAVGERTLVAKFGIMDLFALLVAGIFLVIAWVMNEGQKIEDEQAHTI